MRTYLSGPMRGRQFFNFPAFDAAAADLRRQGITVVNPADIDREDGFDPQSLPENFDWRELPPGFDLRLAVMRDVLAIVDCDAIHLLPGWQQSKGATAERAVAEWLGLAVFEYQPTCSSCNGSGRLVVLLGEGQYDDVACPCGGSEC